MPNYLPATWGWYLQPEFFPILGLIVAKTAIDNKYLMLIVTLTPFIWVFNFIWLGWQGFDWFGAFQTTYRVKSNITIGTKNVASQYSLHSPDDMGQIGLMLSIYFGLMFSFYLFRKYVFGIIWWKKGDVIKKKDNMTGTVVSWVTKGWDTKAFLYLFGLWVVFVILQGIIPSIIFQAAFQWPADWLWNAKGSNRIGNPWNVVMLLIYGIFEFIIILLVWYIWGGFFDPNAEIMLSHWFASDKAQSLGKWERARKGLVIYGIYEIIWHVEIGLFALLHTLKFAPKHWYYRPYIVWGLGVVLILAHLIVAVVARYYYAKSARTDGGLKESIKQAEQPYKPLDDEVV